MPATGIRHVRLNPVLGFHSRFVFHLSWLWTMPIP